MRRRRAPAVRAAVMLVPLLLACGGSGAVGSAFLVDEPPVLPATPPLVTLVCVGDTHGFEVPDGPEDDPLAGVAALLAAPDVFLFNHEGALAEPGTPCPGVPWDAARPAVFDTAGWYLRAPLNVATVANNHVLDCGEENLSATIDALQARGILTVGAGEDLGTACPPLGVVAGAANVTFLAYHAYDLGIPGTSDVYSAGPATPGTARWEACVGAEDVARYKAEGDLVVVSLHMHLGLSVAEDPWPGHRRLVAEVLDAGADVVVGHGSHVAQGLVARGGGVGFHSLGNFLFHMSDALSASVRESVVARVAVHEDVIVVTLHPVTLDAHGRPAPASADDGLRLLDRIATASLADGVRLAIWQGVAYAQIPRVP